jgi:protein TonB
MPAAATRSGSTAVWPSSQADIRLPPPLLAAGIFEFEEDDGETRTVIPTLPEWPQLEPDMPPRPATAAPGAHFWPGAVLASLLLHAFVFAALIAAPAQEEMLIEGGMASEPAASGSALADQRAAGETVTVEIMEIARAVPDSVQPERLSAATRPVEPARTAAATRLEPVRQMTPLQPAKAPSPAGRPQPEVLSAVRATADQAAAPSVEEHIEPAEESTARLSPASEIAAVAALPEPRNIATVAAPRKPEPVTEPVTPAATLAPARAPEIARIAGEEPPSEAERAIAELQSPPTPSPRPERPPERIVEQQAQPAKPRPVSAGSGGQNRADARRGGGGENVTKAVTSGSGRGQAAGNAAVSNYPGKIVTRLRRALRYPPQARRQGLSGEVHVRFTVASNGSVSTVSIARSSGSPILDEAALATVKRAAPFPPIPSEAGRTSWPFTVPLAFTLR